MLGSGDSILKSTVKSTVKNESAPQCRQFNTLLALVLAAVANNNPRSAQNSRSARLRPVRRESAREYLCCQPEPSTFWGTARAGVPCKLRAPYRRGHGGAGRRHPALAVTLLSSAFSSDGITVTLPSPAHRGHGRDVALLGVTLKALPPNAGFPRNSGKG